MVDKELFFDTLLSQDYVFQNDDLFYICGDFDSRCGDEYDYIPGVDCINMRSIIDFTRGSGVRAYCYATGGSGVRAYCYATGGSGVRAYCYTTGGSGVRAYCYATGGSGSVHNSSGICRKLVKQNDKAIQCDECDLWIHTRCTSVDNTTYSKLHNLHNCDPAVECDRCKTWIHNSCAIVSNDEYKNIQATKCTWICPLCDDKNLSSTYLSTSSGIDTKNPVNAITNNRETPSSSICTSDKNRHIYTSKIRMVSINIVGLRRKKLELQAYLQTENPNIVTLQETKINNIITTNEMIQSH
ncbi:unnamed protein product [Mytilus coruscus]|uniref:PHD-type domain-containing protein n=1 Tax=Mytilus coruscus TaxID=42192 RepID=A0A6J8B1I8_MYTCO|nr:unnamed protein product [Mytilus coruscus]